MAKIRITLIVPCRGANDPADGGCIRCWPKEDQGPGQNEDTDTQLTVHDAEVTERHCGVKLHRYRNCHRHRHYGHHCWLTKEELSFKLAAQEKAIRRMSGRGHGVETRTEPVPGG